MTDANAIAGAVVAGPNQKRFELLNPRARACVEIYPAKVLQTWGVFACRTRGEFPGNQWESVAIPNVRNAPNRNEIAKL